MDFLSANDAELEGLPDPDVLTRAADEDRILVTHDLKTMPHHLGRFLQTGRSSPGVLLVPQYVPVGDVIDELVLIWAASEAEEWKNRILRIPLLWSSRPGVLQLGYDVGANC